MDLGAMAMKGYFAFPKALLERRHCGASYASTEVQSLTGQRFSTVVWMHHVGTD